MDDFIENDNVCDEFFISEFLSNQNYYLEIAFFFNLQKFISSVELVVDWKSFNNYANQKKNSFNPNTVERVLKLEKDVQFIQERISLENKTMTGLEFASLSEKHSDFLADTFYIEESWLNGDWLNDFLGVGEVQG